MKYSKEEIALALEKLGLMKGDSLFVHSNIGFFGILENTKNIDDVCEIFFDSIFELIGAEGTIFVPAFTYSFSRGEVFDPLKPPKMGAFSDWFFKHPDSIRSHDPSFSVIGIGKKALSMTKDLPSNSFGKDCFFERFYKINGKILNLNFDAGSTFIHYFERLLDVPYRFDKTFKGTSHINGRNKVMKTTIYVRYLSDDMLEYSSTLFTKAASKRSYFNQQTIGRGSAGIISTEDTFQLIKEEIADSPFFLTKAGIMGIDNPIIKKE